MASEERGLPPIRRYSRTLLALPFLLLLLLALAPAIYNIARSAAIVAEIAGERLPLVSSLDTNPVGEELITFRSFTPTDLPDTHLAATQARIYHPIGIAHPSPIVVVPGLEYLGMNDPRLRNFARVLASHGYLVLTPQLGELADFSITKNSAVAMGDAVHELVRRSGAPRVALMGISFAGGLALIAATDPAVARQLSAVISIGGHDDLLHVLDYYKTNEARGPDGTLFRMKANAYGPQVIAYSHASAFFSPQDVAQARVALRWLLWENLPRAQAEAARLSPAGQARMQEIFTDDANALAPYIERSLDAARPELEAASPHFYLAQLPVRHPIRLTVPVLLLHGAADNVVPPTEMLWLERDILAAGSLAAGAPRGVLADALKDALVSPAVGHVELQSTELQKTSLRDRWRLIEWTRHMLALVDTSSADASNDDASSAGTWSADTWSADTWSADTWSTERD